MELAGSERGLRPAHRRASQLGLRQASEVLEDELGDVDWRVLAQVSDLGEEDAARFVPETETGRTGSPGRRRGKRPRPGRKSAFMTRKEKAASAQRSRDGARKLVQRIRELQRSEDELDLSALLGSINDQTLWELGEAFPRVTKLRLVGWKRFSTAGLRSLTLGFGERLRVIDLSDCPPLTDELVAMVASRFFFLRGLVLQKCAGLHNGSARAVAEACSASLTSIDMSFCSGVSDDSLMWLAGQIGPTSMPCALLQSVAFEGCRKIRDRGLEGLGAACHRLRYANFAHCVALTDRGMRGLCAGCPKLSILNVTGCYRLGDPSLEALGAHCSRELRSVNLGRCLRITDAGLQAFQNCSKLQALNVAGCAEISEMGIYFVVRHNKALQTLNVTGCELVSQRGLEEMLRGLTFVELAKSYTGFKPKPRIAVLKLQAQAQLVRDSASCTISACVRAHGVRLRLARERQARLEKAAAATIQCAFRAHLARHVYERAVRHKCREEAAARLQRWWTDRLGRLIYILQKAKKEEDRRNSVYAVKIQAAYRGKVVRAANLEVPAAIVQMRESRWVELSSAVIVRMQAVVRGRISSSMHAARREELAQRAADMNFAAVKVQSVVRVKLARLLLARRSQWFRRKFARQHRAATAVQAMIRGSIGKRKAKDRQLELERYQAELVRCAQLIQRHYRARLARAVLYARRLEFERRTRAATRIQCVYRGARVPPWRRTRFERTKAHIRAQSDRAHAQSAQAVNQRLELREMGLERDSASEDDLIRALGGFVEEDETDDWQEHWDPVLQRPFFFSPSRNMRTFEPYSEDVFDKALIDKYVNVLDQHVQIWRPGAVAKFNRKKHKHRIEYYDEREPDHEWIDVRSSESRVQVFDEELETWGMLRTMRVAFQQMQKERRSEVDSLNAELSALSASITASSSAGTGTTVTQSTTSAAGSSFAPLPSQSAWDSTEWAEEDAYANDEGYGEGHEGGDGEEQAQYGDDQVEEAVFVDEARTIQQFFDPDTGLHYYFNIHTQETSWDPPEW